MNPPKEGRRGTLSGDVERKSSSIRLKLGCTLQRLFSTFPNSWPGFGLLLLRLCVGAALIDLEVAGLTNPSDQIPFARALIAASGGIFLLVGLWTPAIGILIALEEFWIGSSPYSQPHDDRWMHIFLAILTISLAMLGPGAWSLDARLFGRKRFDINRTRGKRASP